MAKWYERLGSGAKNIFMGGDIGRDLIRDIPVIGPLYGQESSAEQAANDAANIQKDYGQRALDLQEKMYEQGRADQMPWLESGRRSLNTLEGMMNAGEFEMSPEEFDESQYKMPGEFSFTMEDYQESPYAKFLQQEGQRGIERSAASRGGLSSGNTLAGLQKRSMGIASGDYADQYGRARDTYGANYNRAAGERDFGYRNFLDSYGRRASEKGNKYNRLAGMAGTGQTQSQSLGQMGSQYGRSAGEGMMGIGNTLAAGQIGAANARTNQMNQLFNLGGQLGSGYLAGR